MQNARIVTDRETGKVIILIFSHVDSVMWSLEMLKQPRRHTKS